jgi:hypothetical protein
LFRAGATDMTMRANPRLDAIIVRVRIGTDHDTSAGMILGDSRQQLCVSCKRIRFFAVNREIHH